MSKIKYTSYIDGSPKYMYFRKRKHRTKRHGMRYYIWKAKQWAIEASFNY